MLNNIGNWLHSQFDQTGAMNDLNRAVEVTDMAVEATPLDHPDRATILKNLGNLRGRRFDRTGAMEDLNRAVEVADMAVDATSLDHPNRAGWLNGLGMWLIRRFDRTGAMDDLNRAVEVADIAVEATPLDCPGRAAILDNLGVWLGMRFDRTGATEDLERSLSSFKGGWKCHNAPPSIRINLARRAAALLVLQSKWEESSTFLQDAVLLFPMVSPRSLQNTDKQHMLTDFAGLASEAAATALNAGKEVHQALELLELGRGVIAGLLLEMRADISDLERQHPKLADEFVRLQDELDLPAKKTALLTPKDNAAFQDPQTKQHEANQRFNEVITELRAHPGFQTFLLPPTADELTAAADPDPIVVVNISSYRCDAFLIEKHRIRALHLSSLSLKEVDERSNV